MTNTIISNGKTPLSVAVVVLNWNGIDLLRKFMPQWVAQTTLPNVRLIIADNHSTDESIPFLQREFPNVVLIQLETNFGFAEGYNRAIEILTDDIIVLLNSDATLSNDWWQEPEKLFQDPSVWAIQPKLLSYRQPQYFEYAGAAGGFLDFLGYPYCRGRIFDTVEPDLGQYNTPNTELDWATGACLMIRRSSYLELGGLDPLFFAHQEEIDLCWRIRSRGGRILYAPSSVAYHIGGGSLEMNSPRKTYLNFRNNLLMVYKNTPRDSRLIFILTLRFFLDYLSAFLFLLRGQWGGTKAVIQARLDFWRMRSLFTQVRNENKRKRKRDTHPTIFSIVFCYYILGRKHFQDL